MRRYSIGIGLLTGALITCCLSGAWIFNEVYREIGSPVRLIYIIPRLTDNQLIIFTRGYNQEQLIVESVTEIGCIDSMQRDPVGFLHHASVHDGPAGGSSIIRREWFSGFYCE